MVGKKTYLSRNSDIVVPIVVLRYSEQKSEIVDLNEYKQIDVFIRHIADVEPFLKYTTKEELSDNYEKIIIDNNRLLIPIKRAMTKNKQNGDLFFSVAYYEDNAEFEGEMRKGQILEKYLTTLESPAGFNIENLE